MNDNTIVRQIEELVEQERQLQGAATPDAARDERRRAIEIELDRCWDLLRQRRARGAVGLDPDSATPRSIDTVEHYQQ